MLTHFVLPIILVLSVCQPQLVPHTKCTKLDKHEECAVCLCCLFACWWLCVLPKYSTCGWRLLFVYVTSHHSPTPTYPPHHTHSHSPHTSPSYAVICRSSPSVTRPPSLTYHVRIKHQPIPCTASTLHSSVSQTPNANSHIPICMA